MMRVGGQRPFRLVLMRIVGSTKAVLETWAWENLLQLCAAGAKRKIRLNIR